MKYRMRFHGGRYVPAFNVKLGSVDPKDWDGIRTESGAGADFGPEYLEGMDPETLSFYESATVAEALNEAEAVGLALFGHGVTVELTGSRGGWLVVDGLPAPDDSADSWNGSEFAGLAWDDPAEVPPAPDYPEAGATIRERLDYFGKLTGEAVESIPTDTAVLVGLNHYATRREAQAMRDARDAAREGLRKALQGMLDTFNVPKAEDIDPLRAFYACEKARAALEAEATHNPPTQPNPKQ